MRNAYMLFSLCLVLAACGGGVGDGGIPGDTSTNALSAPVIEGVVLDVDGESDLSANVPLQIVETGEVAVTNAEGAFEFYDVPEGDVTIVLAQPGVISRSTNDSSDDSTDEKPEREEDGDDEDDTDGKDDEADDDNERTDREIRIRRIRRGDCVRVDIRIRVGEIIDIELTRTRCEGDDDDDDRCWKRELELEMTPTDGNPDPDMEGEVELEIDCVPCQKFEVEVEDATPGAILVAVVVDPDENVHVLGRREVEPDGDAEWRLDTCDEDELPFGYTRITGLSKHVVCVRTEDGRNLLKARIPALIRDDEPDTCFHLRGRARLRSTSDDIAGLVEVGARGCVGTDLLRQVFRIAGKGFEPGQEIEFFLDDPDDPGQLVSLGTVLANADGEADIEYDTADGDELPFGVGTVRVLTGMRIEVNDDVTGDLLLAGRVPGLMRD